MEAKESQGVAGSNPWLLLCCFTCCPYRWRLIGFICFDFLVQGMSERTSESQSRETNQISKVRWGSEKQTSKAFPNLMPAAFWKSNAGDGLKIECARGSHRCLDKQIRKAVGAHGNHVLQNTMGHLDCCKSCSLIRSHTPGKQTRLCDSFGLFFFSLFDEVFERLFWVIWFSNILLPSETISKTIWNSLFPKKKNPLCPVPCKSQG